MATESEGPQAPATRRGLDLFQVGGIHVRLDVTWLFIFGLVLVSLAAGYFPRAHPDAGTAGHWIAGLVATLLFFLSIVAHELAHAGMARRAGIPVPSITLFLFGGVSEMAREPDDAGTELRVAAVGPLASLGLAIVFYGVHRLLAPLEISSLVAGVPLYLAWINTALAVFNLLPGLPLDGGRVLRALAWWQTGSLRRATRIASNAGKGIAVGLMVLGALEIFLGALVGGLWLILIGLFLRATAEAGYQSLVVKQSLEDVRVSDVAIADPVCVSPDTSLQSLVEECVLRHGHRSYPVVEQGRVVGLIALEDLRDTDAPARSAETVGARMRPLSELETVSPDAPVTEAMGRLSSAGPRLLVLRDGELAGLLTAERLAHFVEIRQALEQLNVELPAEAA